MTRYHLTSFLLIVLVLSGTITLATSLAGLNFPLSLISLTGTFLMGALYYAHRRGWVWASPLTTISILLVTIVLGNPNNTTTALSYSIFIPTIVAALLHAPYWAPITFLSTLIGHTAALGLQTGSFEPHTVGSLYNPLAIGISAVVVLGITLVAVVARTERSIGEQTSAQAKQPVTQGVQTESLAFCAAIVEASLDAMIGLSSSGTILSWNASAQRIYGFPAAEAIGQPFTIVIPPSHHHELQAILGFLLQGQRFEQLETMHCRRDGTQIRVAMTCDPIRAGDSERIDAIAAIVRHIPNRPEAQLPHQTFYDPLTRLPNRILFSKVLRRAIESARWRSDYRFAVLAIDIDRFKLINESLGHPAGDQLLFTIARRFESGLRRPGDTVARLGSDEFAILLDNLGSSEHVNTLIERLQAEWIVPLPVHDREIVVTVSIGIALGNADQNPEDLLLKADSALYRAKSLGCARYALFDPTLPAHASARLHLEIDLRRALRNDELCLYYQPIVSLTTNEIEKLEALIRWQHPKRGFVPPTEFIPIAEEIGLIQQLGEWGLQSACAQMKAWQNTGLESLVVAVNLSAHQFRDHNLCALIRQILNSTGLSPTMLELELTEGSVMDDADLSVQMLQDLQRLGIHIAIDDFGTGFSSLGYLKRFPITTLKIDRSFVWDIGENKHGEAIVRTIISFAHSLNLQVVAEAVETPQQLAFLREHGCDTVQGYLYSPALPADQVTRLLHERRQWLY